MHQHLGVLVVRDPKLNAVFEVQPHQRQLLGQIKGCGHKVGVQDALSPKGTEILGIDTKHFAAF